MRRFAALLCAGIMLAPAPTLALTGEVDTEDKFPYVVRIITEVPDQKVPYLCTGFVRDRAMVVTAAHCVHRGPQDPKITIIYTNAHGMLMRVGVKRIFVAEAYKKARPLLDMLERRDPMSPFILAGVTARIFQQRATLYDVAILLPENPIGLREFAPGTVMDDDMPFSALLSGLRFSEEPWSTEMHTEATHALKMQLGPRVTDPNAIVVGYGSTHCAFNAQGRIDSCDDADGKRRHALVAIPKPYYVHVRDEMYGILLDASETGAIGRTLKGDSGGPIMVHDSLTGSWRIAGVLSLVAKEGGTFASLIQNAQLWKRFEAESDYQYLLKYRERYGAVATHVSNGTQLRRVAGGVGIGDSPEAAAAQAVAICAKDGARGCKVRFAFGGRSGVDCAFASNGKSAKQTFQVGIGTSPAEALARCRKGGFDCQKVIGGCTQ